MKRSSGGVTQVCGVQLCLLYGPSVEVVLPIAIMEGGIDTLQRQSGRIRLPGHITWIRCTSSTQLRSMVSVFIFFSRKSDVGYF